MIDILIGIVLAALLFAALLWSIYRTFTAEGNLRLSQMCAAIFTLGGAAAATYNMYSTAMICGVGCLFAGIIAMRFETRWSRLLPLLQAVFGCILLYAAFTYGF